MSDIACRYRRPWAQPSVDGKPLRASCGLAAELYSVDDPALTEVSSAACEHCVKQFPPSAGRLNPVAAAVVHAIGERVRDRLAQEEWGRLGGDRVMREVARALPVVATQGMSASRPLEPYAGNCFYLGDELGRRPCLTCKGSVKQKVFGCRHEDHDEVVMLDCMSCPDYEATPMSGAVRDWAVGMTTAPRDLPRLGESLRSLIDAGWASPVVFAEPSVIVPPFFDESNVVRRGSCLGAWPNWVLSLQELLLRYPRADAYLMCQDDVEFRPGLRRYLEATLWPDAVVPGVVSLHLATHQHGGQEPGYFAADLGWSAWGAQAYVFSNPAARALLRHPLVVNHRHRGPRDGLKNIDSVVGAWCEAAGLGYVVHFPSLTQHIGETSTIWNGDSLEGRRNAGSFDVPLPEIREGSRSGNGTADRLGSDVRGGEITITCVVIGREAAFQRWLDWLDRCDLPCRTGVRIVDQSGDGEFSSRLVGELDRLRATGRFAEVSLVVGDPAPATAARMSAEREANIAGGYTLALSELGTEFGFLMDDDTIPGVEALENLHRQFLELEACGYTPGAVSGAYRSAVRPDFLVASYTYPGWGRSPRFDSYGVDQLVEVGYVGAGCLFFRSSRIADVLPVRPAHMTGVRGPDSFICDEFRRLGYSLWLSGAAPCEHIC